jgi:hypothetical protein
VKKRLLMKIHVYQNYILQMSTGNIINMETSPIVNIERPKYQKMLFITNALENGWTVKKSNDSYIFTKKHEGKREVFQENYLENFIKTNIGTCDF